jgi:hypothetical protein
MSTKDTPKIELYSLSFPRFKGSICKKYRKPKYLAKNQKKVLLLYLRPTRNGVTMFLT